MEDRLHDDGTASAGDMVSPVKDIATHIDPNFQQQLYELARLANVQIDARLFR